MTTTRRAFMLKAGLLAGAALNFNPLHAFASDDGAGGGGDESRPSRGRLLDINGVRTYVEEAGDGGPLVFVHGFALSSASWEASFAYFAGQGHRAVRYDWRGHGRTGVGPTYRFPQLVDDLRVLLDDLEIERAVICGHSMGGYIALAFAVQHPHRVRKLILADTTPHDEVASATGFCSFIEGPGGVESFWQGFSPVLFSPAFASSHPAAIHSDHNRFLSNRPEGLCHALEALAPGAYDARPSLGGIEMPTLVIAGGADVIFSPATVQQPLAAAIPGARLVLIPGAGHMSIEEQPAAFNAEVTSFLRADPED